MTWFWIIFCFIVALIICFGKHHEEDKKALRDREHRRDGRTEEFIFPLFEDHQDSSGEMDQSDPEDPEDIDEEYSDPD